MAEFTEEELSALNRDELNEVATEAGVEDPESLPNKQAVVDATLSATGGEAAPDAGEAGDETDVLHTSDADAHVEGVSVGDVEPDPQSDPHSSDSPDYQFPVGGDVDASTIPDEEYEGETTPPISPDSWVKLGDSESVPEEVQGAYANIVSTNTDDEEEPVYQVRTRDEHNSTLYLTADDFAEVHPGGVGLRGVGP